MIIHIASQGETLALLARVYSVSTQRIISDNGLLHPYTLTFGQALIITQPAVVYRVKPGDSAYSIAVSESITVQELYQNNPELSYGEPLYDGQLLTIRFWGSKENTLVISGYAYPYINPYIFQRTLPFLTYLAVFSYRFADDGSLIPLDENSMISQARAHRVQPLLVLAPLDEEENFSSQLVQTLLENPALQEKLLDTLIPLMAEKGYRGLDVDFEYIPGENAADYVAFLQRAKERLHANQMILSVAIAPKTSANQPGLLYEGLDYKAIGQVVDQALIMTYEWGYAHSQPRAVAPIDQVRLVLEYAVTEIPPEKILLGIPNYGYNWTLPFHPETDRAKSIGNQEAVELATTFGAVIEYDENAQAPHFQYTQNGTTHEVWFEDVRSIQAKYNLAEEFGLKGAGYWNLMRPFAQNWAFLSTQYHIKKLV